MRKSASTGSYCDGLRRCQRGTRYYLRSALGCVAASTASLCRRPPTLRKTRLESRYMPIDARSEAARRIVAAGLGHRDVERFGVAPPAGQFLVKPCRHRI